MSAEGLSAGGARRSRPGGPLRGMPALPGDKSISHRALILGAMAAGTTRIDGLLAAGDVVATARALRALGAVIAPDPGPDPDADPDAEPKADGAGGAGWPPAEAPVQVTGWGAAGPRRPAAPLDLGNSGTGARLLLGLLAGWPITATLAGDASLSARPMDRVLAPLGEMGATFAARQGCHLPLTVTGAAAPRAIAYRLPVASAQVKSAILLAGLRARGETRIEEPVPCRDHSERMLPAFGAQIGTGPRDGARRGNPGREIALPGPQALRAATVAVPADPSSAAFPLVAALIVPGSEVTLRGVMLNPRRAGLIDTLAEMGADLAIADRRQRAGETLADITARASRLHGMTVPAARVPDMIDEIPILAVAAAFAAGETRLTGLGELRVKECDRLAAIAEGLAACGVDVRQGETSLTLRGTGTPPPGGARIASRADHRIAMSFLVAGLAMTQGVEIDDVAPIATSFPGFPALMAGLGARIEPVAEGA